MRTENFSLEEFLEIWDSTDGQYLQKFIDNANMLKHNYTFGYENFTPRLTVAEVDGDGVATFQVQVETPNPDTMAHYKAALGRNIGYDYQGLSGYTGSITTMGRALNPVGIAEMEQWEKIEKQLGGAVAVVANWMPKLQQIVNAMDSRFSNQAAQLLSTGIISGKNTDNGIELYRQDALVAAENKVKGGAKAWTAADANLLDQMRTIEYNYRLRTDDEQPLKWQIPLAMWRNVFLENAQLKADIIAYRKLKELPTTSGGTVLEDWVVSFINSIGLTSPIEIVKEGEIQQDPVNNSFYDTRKDVKGWADSIAILRPVGMAGEIVKGEILKAKWMGNSKYQGGGNVKNAVAYMRNGMYAVITSKVYDDYGFPTLHTDIEGCFAPALTCAPFMTIVDTSQAD